jgi:transposase
MNVLKRSKREAVLHLGGMGWSLRRIQRELGVRRETVSKYLKQAGIAVRASGRGGDPGLPGRRTSAAVGVKSGQGVSTDSEAELKSGQGVSTDSEAEFKSGQGVSTDPVAGQSLCEPHRDFIERSLLRGRNGVAIWQDLVDDHGFGGKYASVKRFVRGIRGKVSPAAHPFIETEPGVESQVDYGEGPLVRHPDTGKFRRPRLFVLTLGFSRKAVRLLAWRSSSKVWAQLHERAFRRLGGATGVVVLDNLREGVLEPDIYDPELNPLYRDVLAHYGARALPCVVRDPNRKGKVESGIKHAQGTPLRGLRFESLEEAQAYLDRWEERWADTRIHGRTKCQVAARFAEEKPALLPLPAEPFRYYEYGTRVVHRDGCVEVAAAYYSAPPGRIGERLPVQWNDTFVRLLDPVTGQLLCQHTRLRRGRHRYLPGHQPERTAPEIEQILERARRAGTAVGRVAQVILDREGPVAVRRIQGLLGLAKKHSPARLEDACRFSLEAGAASYRFVKRYLGRSDRPEVALEEVHSLLRGLDQYRDLFHQIAHQQEGDE